MADFVQTTVNKTALRNLAVPIANVTSFNTLIQAVDPIVRNREHYIAKVDFLDAGKRVGTVSLQSPTNRRLRCERRPCDRDGRHRRPRDLLRAAPVPRPLG